MCGVHVRRYRERDILVVCAALVYCTRTIYQWWAGRVHELSRDIPGAVEKERLAVFHPRFHTRLCCIGARSRVADSMYMLLHTLLKLAHFLLNVYVAIRCACIATYRKCADLWCGTTELDVLLRIHAKTKKVPRHLVIVLGLCDESVLDCVRIIGWCITLNIPYISFFDRNGKKTIWYQSIYISLYMWKLSWKKKKKNYRLSYFVCASCICMRLCRRSIYLSHAMCVNLETITKH